MLQELFNSPASNDLSPSKTVNPDRQTSAELSVPCLKSRFCTEEDTPVTRRSHLQFLRVLHMRFARIIADVQNIAAD